MADKPIRVSVLEGDFAVMSSIGLPLSLCVQLQVSCLKLNEALWTARSTPDGFSVSLFWPAPAPEKVDGSKRNKKRKRRRAKASQLPLNSFSKTNQATTSSVLPNNTPSATAANHSGHDSPSKSTPSDHDLPSKSTPLQSSTAITFAQLQHTSVSKEKSPPAVVDLSKCAHVEYEVRDGEHGVSFRQTESSEAGWTPVVAKRRRKIPVPQYVRHRFPPDHPIHAVPDPDADSGSDCDLDEVILSEAASIHYKEIDGTPGLSLWTRKTRSWTPVAARTRSKLKN